MKEVRYYIDPASGQPHIHGHNVDETEVEEILAFPGEDEKGGEGTRVAIGKTFGGRYLKVIYSPDEDRLGIFVITAYDIVGNALAAFRRRQRRRS